VNQSTGAIRGDTEKIQDALKPLNATYRACDFNDDEAQKNYKDIISKTGKFPFLLIQNADTGKLIGDVIMNPVSSDDIINAVKNARNGKSWR